jgi:hypothetical protein
MQIIYFIHLTPEQQKTQLPPVGYEEAVAEAADGDQAIIERTASS